MTTYLGIDLGDHGALAWLGDNADAAGAVRIQDMPVVKAAGRYELDIPALWACLRGNPAQVIVMELLHAMPAAKGGASANFKRCGYMYALRAMCYATGTALLEVPPQKWQKHFGYSKAKATGEGMDTKGWSYLQAAKFFPDGEFKTKRGRLMDGRCDAALLALYGRQVWAGAGNGIGEPQ